MSNDIHDNQFDGDLVNGPKYVVEQATNLENALKGVAAASQSDLADFSKNIFSVLEASEDTPIGLEAKLNQAGRSNEVEIGIELKNRFDRILSKHTLSPSKLSVYAHSLDFILTVYRHHIMPMIEEERPQAEIDSEIHSLIIDNLYRVLPQYDIHATTELIAGMVYALGGACRLRWHKE